MASSEYSIYQIANRLNNSTRVNRYMRDNDPAFRNYIAPACLTLGAMDQSFTAAFHDDCSNANSNPSQFCFYPLHMHARVGQVFAINIGLAPAKAS